MTLSDHINLCQVGLDDALEIFETINTQRDYLGKWLPFVEKTRNVTDTINFIRSINSQAPLRRDLVLTIRQNNAFAGLIGLRSIDWENKKTEMGYWLSKPFQGKGIMFNSAKGLLSHSFFILGLNRVQVRVASENHKSNQIPQKLGFKFEGVEREGEKMPTGYRNLNVYSMLSNEFSGQTIHSVIGRPSSQIIPK